MADSYLTFSEVLPQLAAEEEAWLQRQLEPVRLRGGQELAEDAQQEADWCGPRFLADFADHDPHADRDADADGDCDDEFDVELGFQYEFHADDGLPDGWGRHLWLLAEECGNAEQAAHLVQKFLRTFRPRECWWLTYAVTCSKPRAGAFGGGALFVTANTIARCDCCEFVRAQEQTFSQSQPRSRTQPMSNRVHVVPTRFEDVRSGTTRFGVRVFDDETMAYDDSWDDLPEDDLKVLARVLEDPDEITADLLSFVQSQERGCDVGGTWYPWEEIQHLWSAPDEPDERGEEDER
jgi:hypothetical protein